MRKVVKASTYNAGAEPHGEGDDRPFYSFEWLLEFVKGKRKLPEYE